MRAEEGAEDRSSGRPWREPATCSGLAMGIIHKSPFAFAADCVCCPPGSSGAHTVLTIPLSLPSRHAFLLAVRTLKRQLPRDILQRIIDLATVTERRASAPARHFPAAPSRRAKLPVAPPNEFEFDEMSMAQLCLDDDAPP